MHHFFQEKITFKRIIVGVLFVIILGTAVSVQNRYLKQIKKWRPYRDSLYLPRGEYVKLLALGYDVLLADFLWLRAIQAFGGHYMSDRNYAPVVNLFDVITDLNPYFISAYLFGDTVIGEESGDYNKGLELIEKGMIKTGRTTYRLGYWGGYDCVWNLKDYQRGKYFYRMALKTKDKPDYLERLLIYIDEKMGNYHIAFEKRVEDLLRAIDNNDDILKMISSNRLKDVIKQWHIAILREAAQKYKEKFGTDINDLNQLVENNLLGTYQTPKYSRFEEIMNKIGERQSKFFPRYREILDYTMVTYNNELPEDPHYMGYMIVAGLKTEDEDFIHSLYDVRQRVGDFLSSMRRFLAEYKERNGKFPQKLKDLYPNEPVEELLDPFGKPWIYNPETGEMKCSTFPEL